MVSDTKDKSCFQTILHLCVPVHRIHVVIVFIFFEFSFCVSISLAYNSFIISFDFNICPKIIKKKCSLFDWKQVSKWTTILRRKYSFTLRIAKYLQKNVNETYELHIKRSFVLRMYLQLLQYSFLQATYYMIVILMIYTLNDTRINLDNRIRSSKNTFHLFAIIVPVIICRIISYLFVFFLN